MLVLSRKNGERVLIPELNIAITVVSSGTNRVQLGIEAPREFDITRPELEPCMADFCSRPVLRRRQKTQQMSLVTEEATPVSAVPAVS